MPCSYGQVAAALEGQKGWGESRGEGRRHKGGVAARGCPGNRQTQVAFLQFLGWSSAFLSLICEMGFISLHDIK